MFVDKTRVRVTGGAGGNGCCSFRKEKYVPRGGPDGGDGGDGGSVYFVADTSETSLEPVKFHAHWKAGNGAHGGGGKRAGKNGEDVRIKVPPGTVVREIDTERPLADLTKEGAEFCAVRGGQGGRGNSRFATSTNRAPRFAETGEPGQDAEYVLELKLIADVGLVGLPNAGKSTLLSRLTAAQPKIAGYPFTTLVPNIGVACLSGYRRLTLGDIPGIIEGAAGGKGLGHDFLRHIERTKVLLFLVDLGDEDPRQSFAILEDELVQHRPAFADRPHVVALNKADIPDNRAKFDEVAAQFEEETFMISAATGENTEPLLERLWDMVESARRESVPEDEAFAPQKEYKYEPPYQVEKAPDGYRVKGDKVVRLIRMTDFGNEYAVNHLHKSLSKMGLFKTLARMGAQPGTTIHIGNVELEYQPD